jgi:hypothetical protein
MKFSVILGPLLLIIGVLSCKHEKSDPIVECTSGCYNLSKLENRQNFYLPFSLVNDIDSVSKVIINSEVVKMPLGGYFEFKENGFYELVLVYKNKSIGNDTILFTTKTQERELAEWGIKAWVPVAFETSTLGPEDVEVFYPRRYIEGIKVPFIFYINESGKRKSIYLNATYPVSGNKFFIKQGVGSVNVSSSTLSNQNSFDIGGKLITIDLAKTGKIDMELQGTITENLDIPANSLVKITGNLNVSSSGSITVHEGAILLINEAVDIKHQGPITFVGNAGNPILVTCSDENKFWGGFITDVPSGEIKAQYTIFCQSGYHESGNYNWGHAMRQALFYTANSILTLNHCFFIDHIGQIFFPQKATLDIDNILVQRAKTSGQLNNTKITILNSVFTDFPDDSQIYQDKDNDALYISASDATIDNSVFMFAKDDGLDSGNDEGGTLNITNCRFEACFHEGAALSSKNSVIKNHNFLNCVFTNCGQGLELGFSSPNHTVVADHCEFIKNGIGIRYGDNYAWSVVNGKMIIKNSSSLYNDRDVWNMVCMDWSPKLGNLQFENTIVSKLCPQYPGLKIFSE